MIACTHEHLDLHAMTNKNTIEVDIYRTFSRNHNPTPRLRTPTEGENTVLGDVKTLTATMIRNKLRINKQQKTQITRSKNDKQNT
ncbi:hypothetical protein DRO48_03140 [Candidatus Bathyarchaeota archaeon]|nr:MAG: hypothetical protein DRO48_03140 [Candidatus Bathyarchaeota archaeon]